MGAMDTYGSGATKGRRQITYSNDKRNTNGSKLRYEIFCHLLTVSFLTWVPFGICISTEHTTKQIRTDADPKHWLEILIVLK